MTKLKYFLVASIAMPFCYLPLALMQKIGAWLGRRLMGLNEKRLKVAQRNIGACLPELSGPEREKLLTATAEETGKWICESLYVWFRKPDYLANKVICSNPELLEKAHQKGKGVIIILPHLGNFELLNFYVPLHYEFGAMYRPVKSELGEKIIFRGRSRVGTSMFAATTGGVRAAFKHLKQGKVLAVLSDHLPSWDAGIYAPFFGISAHTGKLTHSLAKFNHSEVLLAAVIRLPNAQGFEITFYLP